MNLILKKLLSAGHIVMLLVACAPQPAQITPSNDNNTTALPVVHPLSVPSASVPPAWFGVVPSPVLSSAVPISAPVSEQVVVFADIPKEQQGRLVVEEHKKAQSDFKTSAFLGTKAVLEATVTYKGMSKALHLEKTDLTLGGVTFELFSPIGSQISATLSVIDSDTSKLIRKGVGEITLSSANMALQLSMQELQQTPVSPDASASSQAIDARKPQPTDFEMGGNIQEVTYPTETPTPIPTPIITPSPATGGGDDTAIPIDEIAAFLQVSNSQLGILEEDINNPVALREKVSRYFEKNLKYSGAIPTYESSHGTSTVLAFYKNGRGSSVVQAEETSEGYHQLAWDNPLIFANAAHNWAYANGCLTGTPLMSWDFIPSGTLFQHKILCFKNDYKPYGTIPFIFANIPEKDINGPKNSMPELMATLVQKARASNFLTYIPIDDRKVNGEPWYQTIAVQASMRQAEIFNSTLNTSRFGKLLLGSNYQGMSLGYLAQSIGPNTCTTGLHPGIDYPAPVGTKVYSPANAVVSSANESNGTLVLRLVHNPDKRLMFLHLNNFNGLQVGDPVSAFEVIGEVGVKGFSTGPHLHVELRSGTNSPSCYFSSAVDVTNNFNPVTFNK